MNKKLAMAATALTTAGLVAGMGSAAAAETSDAGNITVRAGCTNAGTYYDYCFTDGGLRGLAGWKRYGDHMLARDIRADGYWIKVDWHTDYGRDGKLADGSSKGDGNQENYNMRESGKIRFQLEIWDGDRLAWDTNWSDYVPIGQ